MSRKARIPEEERLDWVCVRAWAASRGLQPYKQPRDGYLRDALVILEHEAPPAGNPMRGLAGVAQELLFADPTASETGEGGFSAVVVVDMSALRVPRETDEPGSDIVAEEALLQQFGKRTEKPVVRFLERLYLRGATVVARGACCQFAAKLLSPTATRALTAENVKRIVMLHPTLPPAFINEHLGTRAASKLKDVALDVVYPTAKEQRRRDPILRFCCPIGTSMMWADITRENAEVLLPVLLPPAADEEAPPPLVEPPVYDPDRVDPLGRSQFFVQIRIELDPISKMDKQVIIDVTAELQVQ